MHKVDQKVLTCIDECSKCFQECESTFEHCSRLGGKHAEQEHLKLLRDCASICKVSEEFMLRHSEFMKGVCMLCAEICKTCASSCEEIDPKDEHMKKCAAQCKSCSSACSEMGK